MGARCLPVSYHVATYSFIFFFNDTAPAEIYTLSLHDALPICAITVRAPWPISTVLTSTLALPSACRSEEHTSELQSRQYLVCRLLLEKKKNKLPKHQELKHHEQLLELINGDHNSRVEQHHD